ncbi:MAG: Crp/Fnr family transcriptional regulator [Clostridia bacterium]|nr:Crp/Fnr family transcriptional regulator [Clostridia bacterium]
MQNLKNSTHLTDSDIEHLQHNALHKTYNKGYNIHGDDGTCTGVVFINSGIIRIYIMSDEGKEITLYRLYEDDFCMLSASCVLQSISFEVHVDAETDCDVFVIRPDAFRNLMDRNLYLANYALNTTVGRFSEVMWAMQQVLFMSLDKRLAVFLYDEYARTGRLLIKMTHEQIAKHIGSAREVVSRMLKYLSRDGIVEVVRGGITILDKSKLQNLIHN